LWGGGYQAQNKEAGSRSEVRKAGVHRIQVLTPAQTESEIAQQSSVSPV
jgi:hypothetical protein